MRLTSWGPWAYLTMELRRRFARARASQDLGASAIEWVIITGILVAIAGVVGLIIYNLVTKQAEAIKMPTVGGP